ncbi:MAG: MFS transporter [Chloroflexi bacterium]|nr:MFS transporter [Chloroflexota bacterium]
MAQKAARSPAGPPSAPSPAVTMSRAAAFYARLGALASPRYRRFWFGSWAAVGGTQLATAGTGWLVSELSDSPFNLGVVGAATAIPTILINLFGGVMADRLDRKLLLIGTSTLAMALAAVLTLLDATNWVLVWHIVAISIGFGFVYGLDWPVRQAFFPALITRDQMRSAVALNSILWQGTRVVVPSFAGVMIAVLGTESVFVASAAGFFAMTIVLISLRIPRTAGTGPARNVVHELGEGIRYIGRQRVFLVLILLTFSNHFFGLEYIQLMPAFAKEFFPDDPDAASRAFGTLLGVAGVGAVSGTFVAAKLQSSRRLGLITLAGPFLLACAVWAFAASPSYPVAVIAIFFAGLVSSVFLINSMTVLQMRVEDRLRGRVMGIHGITFSLIPLGALFGGAVAEAVGVRTAVSISAGILALVVLLITITQKEIRDLDGRRL